MMVSNQGLSWLQAARQVGNHESAILGMKHQRGPERGLGVPQLQSDCPVRTSSRNRIETNPDSVLLLELSRWTTADTEMRPAVTCPLIDVHFWFQQSLKRGIFKEQPGSPGAHLDLRMIAVDERASDLVVD